jgi:hypothetical protein
LSRHGLAKAVANHISIWVKSTDPGDQADEVLLCCLISIYASGAPVMIYRLGASPAEAIPWCRPKPNLQPIA